VTIRVRGAIERRRLLQEVQDLRASFTSMLVHDLRSPLTVFGAFTDLLEKVGPLTDRQQRYVRKMRDSCAQMIRLIGEILDVSKLEAGKLTLEPRPLSLAALATEVVEQFQPVAQQKRIALEARSTPVPTLLADPVRLEQVLMNLLGNALKFTPDGGAVTVDVADVGDAVEVAVTGPARDRGR